MARRDGGRGRRSGGPRTGQGHDEPVPGTPADLTPDADPVEVARAIALRQLTVAPRTRAQLARAMARRGVSEEVADAVLDRFEEVQLVDDELFARQWVQSRHAGRGLARRALRQELRERGVAEETVAAAVEEIDEQSELDAARELVRRRLVGMRFDDPLRRRRRLAGMLARRGYGTGVAMRAIREAIDEQESHGEADGADRSGDGDPAEAVDHIDEVDWGERGCP